MNGKLEKMLEDEFPFMRRAPGCDCGNGWFELLRGFCADIAMAYKKRGFEPDIDILQIKEKFGQLRFYYSAGFERDGGKLSKELDRIVRKWEKESLTVCELCGAKGSLRTVGWYQVRCDECEAGKYSK